MGTKKSPRVSRESNLARLSKEVFAGGDLKWKPSPTQGPAFQFVETPKTWYLNKVGTDIVYVQPRDDTSMPTCYGCNSDVMSKNQRVNIWDRNGPGPCAGGDVGDKLVRYCPTCEGEPSNTAIDYD